MHKKDFGLKKTSDPLLAATDHLNDSVREQVHIQSWLYFTVYSNHVSGSMNVYPEQNSSFPTSLGALPGHLLPYLLSWLVQGLSIYLKMSQSEFLLGTLKYETSQSSTQLLLDSIWMSSSPVYSHVIDRTAINLCQLDWDKGCPES
jgi:hypothetical protein